MIASINIPYNGYKTKLVEFRQTIWKIPLTFFAMVIGASVGREGPSVQVGAAVMLSWGNFCRKYNFAFRGLSTNELIATGAAGGLAAAFNAPLAGVIFAIEELGRGMMLRWERRVLLGVLAAGFILVAIQGNSPYFPAYKGATAIPYLYLWLAICGVVCGVLGGIFGRLLAKGLAGLSPLKWRDWIRKHPIYVALLLGLVLAAMGTYSEGQTYGTGYNVVARALEGQLVSPEVGILKLFATVTTYWNGIAGGIFTPSLTTGAGIGTMLWEISNGMVDQRFLVILCMAAFFSRWNTIPCDSKRSGDGNDGGSTCADLALDFQYHCLHNFRANLVQNLFTTLRLDVSVNECRNNKQKIFAVTRFKRNKICQKTNRTFIVDAFPLRQC